MENDAYDSVKMKHIEDCVCKSDRICIDTCSILDDKAIPFLERLSSMLQKHGKKLYLAKIVYDELMKKRAEEPGLVAKVDAGKHFLDKMRRAGLLTVIGSEKDDSIADNIFLAVFTRYRVKYRLMLITQDRNLATEVYGLNDSKAVRGRKIIVKSIDEQGYLRNFYPMDNDARSKARWKTGRFQRFRTCTQVTPVPDEVMPVQEIPGEQGLAFTAEKVPVRLRQELAEGGEGFIYETDGPEVVKIYKADNITRRRYEKLKRMLDKELKHEGICFPTKMLYNQHGEFVGYLMPRAKGKELNSCVFRPQRLKVTFKDWKKRELVELALTILDKIKYLNDRNIILGDINPKNILVVSSKEVYFVDTDSYQIEDYPCPVGMTNFTPPENQGKDFSTFLRERSAENFAIATLLFMLMLPGKPPYAQQGGGTAGENIRKGDFPYPLKGVSNGKAPKGRWRHMWSHLPVSAIKVPFYETFKKGGKNNKAENRLSVDSWIGNFKEYLRLLDNGVMAGNDPMSEDIFPKRFKHSRDVTYIRCEICGKLEVDASSGDTICRACMDDPKYGLPCHCHACHKEIIYTAGEQNRDKKKYGHLLDIHFCDTCAQKPYKVEFCRECHKNFEISNDEARFFLNKNMNLPKRCPACRSNKVAKGSATSMPRNNISRNDIPGYHSPAHSKPQEESSEGAGIWSAFKKIFFG